MQELSEQLQELQDKERESETKTSKSNVHDYQSSVKDKILAIQAEDVQGEKAPAEMLRDLDQQMEKRADNGLLLYGSLYRFHCKVSDAIRFEVTACILMRMDLK
ncbi:hypothetical protein Tco_1563158 [Tanacetum coccineum]